MLQYKTRGGASPQGRPRVYFSCHPGDFASFFPSLSEELLETQKNCALWYDDAPDEPHDEQFLADLGQMQLFVMPVTYRLLTTPSRAMDVEFPFAIEHHIPVLPLMQERGLEALFAEKFGDLQFLDRFNTDPTAIPYNEKLEKYLSSVLIGDELAEKIRAAFDAYVFLSYRKKDRKFAQELMRLIHKNDFCRDLAIWYDEFLTPGEDFNDAIRDALEKSKLFVLTVTPNLVNEPNYIMTTEYPMAKEAGKPILPAELDETDPALLAKSYDGLPACVNARDDDALSESLLDALRDLALLENDTSPEHRFFIGLAYLGGVDVEVDHERAVSLITSAADEGLLEAMDKLVEMYRSGLGVERSYETAVLWLEKKVRWWKELYQAKSTEEHLSELVCSTGDCGDAYRELRKLQEAQEWYQEGLAYLTAFPDADTSRNIRRNISVVHNRLGDIAQKLGDLKAAKTFFEKSLEIDEALVREADTPEAKRHLSISYNKLGDIAQQMGDLKAAKNFFEKALVITEALARETDTPKAKRDLSISYSKLGSIAQNSGDLKAAKTFFEKDLEIAEALVRETDTPKAKRDLSISYNNLGNIAQDTGDLKDAKSFFEKSLEIAEALVRETDTPEAKRDLSISYNKLGDIARKMGDLKTAKSFFEKALEIAEALVRETDTPEAKRDLSISYNNLGDIAQNSGDLKDAKNFFEKGLEIAETLARETDTPEAKRDLSISYNKLGNIAQKIGDLKAAKNFFEKGLKILEALARETDTPEAKRDLSVSYDKLGNIAQNLGDLQTAKSFFEKSLEIAEGLVWETDTPESQDDLAVSYYKLAAIAQDGDEQQAYLKKAYIIYEELTRRSPDSTRYRQNLKITRNALKKTSSPFQKLRDFFKR